MCAICVLCVCFVLAKGKGEGRYAAGSKGVWLDGVRWAGGGGERDWGEVKCKTNGMSV